MLKFSQVEKRALLKENGDKPQPLHLLLWCQTPQVIISGLLGESENGCSTFFASV